MEINIYLTNSFLTNFYQERMSVADEDTLFSHLVCRGLFEQKIFINIINQIMEIDYWKYSKYGDNKYYTT